MIKSYLVKSPVHFADSGFFVKVGDILVHDASGGNRLTVYRNGEVVKAVKQTSLGIAAMLKNEFITEVVQTTPSPKAAPKAPAKPSAAVAKASAAAGASSGRSESKEGSGKPKPETYEGETVIVIQKPEEVRKSAKIPVKPVEEE